MEWNVALKEAVWIEVVWIVVIEAGWIAAGWTEEEWIGVEWTEAEWTEAALSEAVGTMADSAVSWVRRLAAFKECRHQQTDPAVGMSWAEDTASAGRCRSACRS